MEHNIYIGQSIAKNHTYHPSLLKNIRLWQLLVMIEMEFLYKEMRSELKFDLEVASLILALDNTMSIRYRIDEKHFDVDGAYNVRYEIMKKRIDKVHIKNSEERLTTKEHLSIVYSNPEIGEEYEEYLQYLIKKELINPDYSIFELEDVQGVSGMYGLRAKINFEKANISQDFYSYEDLLNVT